MISKALTKFRKYLTTGNSGTVSREQDINHTKFWMPMTYSTSMKNQRPSYLSCSITRVQLNAKLLSLFPQPAHKVPQPDNIVTMILHGQAYER